jgi:hypothetical protein
MRSLSVIIPYCSDRMSLARNFFFSACLVVQSFATAVGAISPVYTKMLPFTITGAQEATLYQVRTLSQLGLAVAWCSGFAALGILLSAPSGSIPNSVRLHRWGWTAFAALLLVTAAVLVIPRVGAVAGPPLVR